MFRFERTSADAGGLFEIEGSSAVAAGGFVPGGGEETPIVVGVISPLWWSRPTAAVKQIVLQVTMALVTRFSQSAGSVRSSGRRQHARTSTE